MVAIIEVFKEYAGKQGDKLKMNKAELKKLLTEQFPGMEEADDQEQVKELMAGLDIDGDSELDFSEFMIYVTSLTIIMNEFFRDFKKNTQ